MRDHILCNVGFLTLPTSVGECFLMSSELSTARILILAVFGGSGGTARPLSFSAYESLLPMVASDSEGNDAKGGLYGFFSLKMRSCLKV